MTTTTSSAALAKSEATPNVRLPRMRLREIFPFLGLVFVVILFAILTDGRSISPQVLQLIALQSAILMIGCIGVTFTMSHGSLDFSLGGIVGISATMGALAGSTNPLLALPISILVGLIAGLTVGALSITFGIPVFIVSLAMMFFGRGITGLITSQLAVSAPAELAWLDEPWLYYLALGIALAVGIVLFGYTKIGKYNKAIGSNPRAAVMSGVPVTKYKLIAFGISGIALGLCAFLNMIRGGGVSATTGAGFEIDVLIALVLGGISITGGTHTRIRGAVIGALIYTMLSNGLIMISVPPNVVGTIKGIVFLFAVAVAYDRKAARFIT